MSEIRTKGNQQAIDQALCGSRTESKKFTSQPAVQFPSKERFQPLIETNDISLASEKVS